MGGNKPRYCTPDTGTPSQSKIFSSNNGYYKSHCRTSTPSQSEISGKTPKWWYYQPQEDQETYCINSEGHLQCHQDPQKTIGATKLQELPGSREHPIYIKPGSVPVKSVDNLLRLYPDSFDRLSSLKGEYGIKVDPTVPPVQHARRMVPIESRAAIKEAIDYMVQDILEPQIAPTPWASLVTYPVKPSGEARPCLDARDLNKAIIRENHKSQTVEEIEHQLAWVVVSTKADALKAFLQVHLTEASSKLLVINTQKGSGKVMSSVCFSVDGGALVSCTWSFHVGTQSLVPGRWWYQVSGSWSFLGYPSLRFMVPSRGGSTQVQNRTPPMS